MAVKPTPSEKAAVYTLIGTRLRLYLAFTFGFDYQTEPNVAVYNDRNILY